MSYTLKLQALVFRRIIRNDMPEEFLNKMTDEELLHWYGEVKEKLLKKGIDESMMTWKFEFEEIIIERRNIYEIFKDKFIYKI